MDELPGRSLSCPLWNPFEIVPQTCDIRKAPTLDAVDFLFAISVSFFTMLILTYLTCDLFCLIHAWRSRDDVVNLSEDTERINDALQVPAHKCSICFATRAEFPVVINCGHVFCCDCIISWWIAKNNMFGVGTCAYCRQMFTKLTPIQWPTISEDPKIKKDMNVYNRRFSADRTFIDSLRDFPAFLCNYLRDPTGALAETLGELRIWLRHPLSWFYVFFVFVVSWTYKQRRREMENDN